MKQKKEGFTGQAGQAGFVGFLGYLCYIFPFPDEREKHNPPSAEGLKTVAGGQVKALWSRHRASPLY